MPTPAMSQCARIGGRYSTIMSLALQIFNTYRSRWCGFYWQSKGLSVIPTVSWSDERSYDFCFDGIEQHSIVAVSTIGCAESKKLFMAGFMAMCDKIEPQQVICYARPFAEMGHYAEIIEVPYKQNVRVAPALSIAEGI